MSSFILLILYFLFPTKCCQVPASRVCHFLSKFKFSIVCWKLFLKKFAACTVEWQRKENYTMDSWRPFYWRKVFSGLSGVRTEVTGKASWDLANIWVGNWNIYDDTWLPFDLLAILCTHPFVQLHSGDGEYLVAGLPLLLEVVLAQLHLDLVLAEPR